jgi:acetoin utilization protein AcuC
VDLDAHHGDGVQDAFASDARVYTVSIHEQGRWPHTGHADDVGGGRACNLPVPPGFNDSELEALLEGVVLPLAERIAPQAVVLTCGADALAGDPLSRMALSNVALWSAVERLAATAPAAVVLGGGGYNPWTTVRYWTGLWGCLSKRRFPDALPVETRAILESLSCDLVDDEDIQPAWMSTLADPPKPGPVRPEVAKLVERNHALA